MSFLGNYLSSLIRILVSSMVFHDGWFGMFAISRRNDPGVERSSHLTNVFHAIVTAFNTIYHYKWFQLLVFVFGADQQGLYGVERFVV